MHGVESKMAVLTYSQAKRLIRIDSYREIAEEYEKILNLGIEARWNKSASLYENTDLDPADEAYDEVELLRLFKYRMSLMLICCLCETWEQDLFNFLKEEGILVSTNNEYGAVKSCFNSYFTHLSLDNYSKIKEMRDFVNAIKHGKGRSFENIKHLLGDSILADSNLGYIAEDGSEHIHKQIKYDDNVLTSITINPNGKIKEYYDSILDFWQDVFNELDNMRGNL